MGRKAVELNSTGMSKRTGYKQKAYTFLLGSERLFLWGFRRSSEVARFTLIRLAHEKGSWVKEQISSTHTKKP